MNKRILVVALATFLSSYSFATNLSVKGRVSEKENPTEPLIGANVYWAGTTKGTTSDLDGNFTVQNVCNGKCSITISMISYADRTMEVDTENGQQLRIELSQR